MKTFTTNSLVRFAFAAVACLTVCVTSASTVEAAENAVHTIKYSQVGSSMKDGDNIYVSVTPNACPLDKIKIKLVLGNNVTWWKGIMLFKKDANNDYQILCELQDDRKSITAEVDLSLFEERDLVLSKAKAFGVHTNMYYIQDAPQKMQGGCQYTFTWTRD